ncbi:uncharacterized protein LOC131606040 [Vicia villosa]|uniref:uncharacterized protein LOC131606040 n=1 Tax=Vicia villosa TaxID=3911 RepID=UPI00273C9405|nr:uncharacterized protein LOC131606040 [Vicia villosa]
MDKSGEIQQEQENVTGVAPCASQMAYSHNQNDPLVASGPPFVAVPTPAQPLAAFSNSIDQLQQQQDFHHQLQQQQQQQLKVFWENQMQEIVQTNCFSKHSFPPTHIKRIMKMDEDVQLVSANAPVLFAKACEMFLLDVTLRSWFHAKENKRSKLQKNDIAAAIENIAAFDFLLDIIPKDELKEEEGPGIAESTIPIAEGHGIAQTGPAADLPPQHPVGSTGMVMGNPFDQAALYSTLHPQPPNPNPRPPQQQSTTLYSTIPIEEGRGIELSTIPIAEGLRIAQSTIPIADGLGIAQSNIPITGPANQMQEIIQTDCFSKHSFPPTRIKKIMKMDKDVLQVSADAPVLFAKACEMFIFDLTSQSWTQAKEIKRNTLQKSHVAAIIASNVAFNFLVDIIPKDELKEEEGPGILGFAQSTIPIMGPAADLPYNDVPPQHPVGSTEMIMGNPIDQATLYSTLQPNPNPQPTQQQSTTLHSTQLPRPPYEAMSSFMELLLGAVYFSSIVV